MRKPSRASWMAIGAVVGVAALCVARGGDVAAAIARVPPWPLAAAVALHLATLVLRSEAWRLSLRAAGAHALTRDALHGANAAAFVAGAVQSHAALAARVAVLRRVAGELAPRPAQICVADVPIVALELVATALLLAVATVAGRGSWLVAAGALALAGAVLAGARLAPARLPRRSPLRGLAVLADRKRRGALAVLVAAVSLLTAVRVWLVLAACGLPHGVGEVAATFAALGVFGLLPLGPSAPAGATVAIFGAGGVGAALVAGLLLGASSIIAVAGYALAVAAATRALARR